MTYQIYEECNPEIMMKQFRSRLRAVQKCLGLRADDMAAIAGISRTNYQKYLSGDIKLPVDRMLVLTKELRIDGNYLLTGDSTSGMFRKMSVNQSCECEIGLLNIKAYLEESSENLSDKEKLKLFRLMVQLGNQI